MELNNVNTLQTVLAYKSLAADSLKQKGLLKDVTALQFLAYVLDSDHDEIVEEALNTFDLLMENKNNRTHLSSAFGVIEALIVFSESTFRSSEQRETAKRFAQLLKASKSSGPLREKQNTSQIVQDGDNNSKIKQKSKIYTFLVRGLLTQDDRQLLESVLVRVKGVVSLVVHVESLRVTVRVRSEVTPDRLADAVAATKTMALRLVTRNHCGEEITVRVGTDVIYCDKENAKLPEYLPEDNEVPGVSAVSRSGLRDNALSWMNSAASFLTKSFYW